MDAARDESNIDDTTQLRDLINELNGIQVETQPKESKPQKDEMDAACDESNIDDTTQF